MIYDFYNNVRNDGQSIFASICMTLFVCAFIPFIKMDMLVNPEIIDSDES